MSESDRDPRVTPGQIGSWRIGPWQPLPVPDGPALAVDGDRLAVASQAHLAVWSTGGPVASAEAPWPIPGRPRFLGDRVLWGPGVLDLATGRFELVPGPAPAPQRRPDGGEYPSVYAWSPDGRVLLVGWATGRPDPRARIDLLDAESGERRSTPWAGQALPPGTAWVGDGLAVVGLSDLLLVTLPEPPGRPAGLASVPTGAGTIVALDADAAQRRLIAVDLNQALWWVDLPRGQIVDRWTGPWVSAAISPDGALVAAVDLDGGVRFAELARGRIRPLGELAVIGRPRAVALDSRTVVGSGGGTVARANYHR